MGLCIAHSILESGGDVICIDRAASALAEPWAEALSLSKEHGTKIRYLQCEVTDADAVDAVFADAMLQSRYPFNGMVACAGISGGGNIVGFDLQEAKRIMDVNVMGTLACCQAAGREFLKQNSPGSVVLIASMSGHVYNKVLYIER